MKTIVILATIVVFLGTAIAQDKDKPPPKAQCPETLVVLRKYEMDNAVELKRIALEERKVDVEELKQLKDGEEYKEELKTKTIPWVDALHKMGRQIMNYVLVGYALVCVFTGHEITQYELLLIGGPNIAYQLIKGKGVK